MELKKCTNCKLEKDLNDFNKNKSKKDGLNNICRICSNIRCNKYYLENKVKHKENTKKNTKKIIQKNRINLFEFLKSNPCVDCGEIDPIVLEFDHIDPKTKIENISTLMTQGFKWSVIKEEIDKCEIRCANCHKRKTAKQQNWYKYMR